MVELEVYGWYCDSWSVLKSRSVSWQNSNPNTWFDCIYVVVGRDQWIQLFFNHPLLKAAIVTKFGMQHYIFERMINLITSSNKLKTDAENYFPFLQRIYHILANCNGQHCMHAQKLRLSISHTQFLSSMRFDIKKQYSSYECTSFGTHI